MDDFLLSSEARSHAKNKYTEIFFSLYNSRISDEFDGRDQSTKDRKTSLQNFGLLTVALAFLALLFAAVDVALFAPNAEKSEVLKLLAKSASLLAALLGILSFSIGYFGAGIGKRKKEWLLERMKAELIRQWRARYYLIHRDSILDSALKIDKQSVYKSRGTSQ
jgi:hypothetical protein